MFAPHVKRVRTRTKTHSLGLLRSTEERNTQRKLGELLLECTGEENATGPANQSKGCTSQARRELGWVVTTPKYCQLI